MREIDRLVAGEPVGVSVREEGEFLYRHADVRRRAPASNEKLLLAMAILDRLGPEATLMTQAAAGAAPVAGVVAGDLWILGTGDPDVRRTTMVRLAQEVVAAGVVRIEGAVVGSTGFFKRDWRAPGWKADFPRTQVALPTALVFEGNQAGGVHITDPELRAARALTQELRERGVGVAGKAGAAAAPLAMLPGGPWASAPSRLPSTSAQKFDEYWFMTSRSSGSEADSTWATGTNAVGAWAAPAFPATATPRDRSSWVRARAARTSGSVTWIPPAWLPS